MTMYNYMFHLLADIANKNCHVATNINTEVCQLYNNGYIKFRNPNTATKNSIVKLGSSHRGCDANFVLTKKGRETLKLRRVENG